MEKVTLAFHDSLPSRAQLHREVLYMFRLPFHVSYIIAKLMQTLDNKHLLLMIFWGELLLQ